MPTITQESGKNWTLFHGDCCDVARELPDESIDLSVYSPPFSTLYIYSDSDADMGNCASNEEFFEHYKYLLPELLRATVTGRLCVVHCKDLPKYANRDGTAGLIDFPGELIRAHEACGWSYHSRVTIWKCPVVERERTNTNGLLHKTVLRDRSQLRQGMADYLIVFRKPPAGTLMSVKPITRDIGAGGYDDPGAEGFQRYVGDVDPNDQDRHPSPHCRKSKASTWSIDVWRRYAEPVWWDVNQTRVLNCGRKQGEKEAGERHICPLQLDVIERSVQIWSNPGDVVFSPFAGYGSEGVGALSLSRRFAGVELNREYYERAVKNLMAAEESQRATSLFDTGGV